MKKMMTLLAVAAVVLAMAPGATADITASGTLTPAAATWESGYITGSGTITDGSVTVDGGSTLTNQVLLALQNGTFTISSGGKVIVGETSADQGNFMLADNLTGKTVTLTVTGTGSTFIQNRGVFARGTLGTSTRNIEITDGGVFLRSGLSGNSKGGWYATGGLDIDMSNGAMGVNFSTVTTLANFLSTDLDANTAVYYYEGGVKTQLTGSSDQERFALTQYDAGNSTPDVKDGTATPAVAPTWSGSDWILNGVDVDGYTFLSVLGDSGGGPAPTPGTLIYGK